MASTKGRPPGREPEKPLAPLGHLLQLAFRRSGRYRSKNELIREIGTNVPTWRRWEVGESDPQWSSVQKVARALGCSTEDFRTDVERRAYPALEEFLRSAEGQTATEDEVAHLRAQVFWGEPTPLTYHYELLKLRTISKASGDATPAQESVRDDAWDAFLATGPGKQTTAAERLLLRQHSFPEPEYYHYVLRLMRGDLTPSEVVKAATEKHRLRTVRDSSRARKHSS